MEIVESCPVCDCKESNVFTTTNDFLLTQQVFKIVSCQACGFKYTNPRADKNRVGAYYKFDASVRDRIKEPFGSIAQKSNTYGLLRTVSSFYKKGTIIDIGYQTSAFIDLFKYAKWNTQSIALAELVSADFNTLNEQGRSVIFSNIESNSADVILLWHSLNKVYHLNQFIVELKRILKPQGLIVVAAPNPNSFDANYFKQYWEAYNLPRNLYHFSPQDIDAIFNKHKMKVFRTIPLVYDAYSSSFWSEKNKSGKASPFASFLIGLQSNIAGIKSGKRHSAQLYLISK